mmetsp:Transcript_1397/g.5639  ORF Transcript_1397/g.5639 Transcript_1397/m.5639 type:complete len:121 (-) Transcript_1397:709-1071(-)
MMSKAEKLLATPSCARAQHIDVVFRRELLVHEGSDAAAPKVHRDLADEDGFAATSSTATMGSGGRHAQGRVSLLILRDARLTEMWAEDGSLAWTASYDANGHFCCRLRQAAILQPQLMWC